MRLWAHILTVTLLLVFSCAGTIAPTINSATCPDQDVWVFIKHPDNWHQTCIVIVHIPKHSLKGDSNNCPDQDIKVVGGGWFDQTQYAGMQVVVLKKGTLNDPNNYTTQSPRRIRIPENNFTTWHAKK